MYSNFVSKFAPAPLFFTFEQYFMFFSTKKTLHKVIFLQICLRWIRIRILKAAGSGSAFRKTAGPGSAKNEWGSTALLVIYSIITLHMQGGSNMSCVPLAQVLADPDQFDVKSDPTFNFDSSKKLYCWKSVTTCSRYRTRCCLISVVLLCRLVLLLLFYFD